MELRLSFCFTVCFLFLLEPQLFAEAPDRTGQKGAAPGAGPLVIGHRGLISSAPENTHSGFRGCMELRVGFELDIRRTKDGRLVCLHDDTLDRTTSGQGKLADQSWSMVKKLDAGSWFDPSFSGERVPEIGEIMESMVHHKFGIAAVDLKETGSGMEEAVVELAKKLKLLDRLVFIGETIGAPEIRRQLKKADKGAQPACLATAAEEIQEVLEDDNADWVYVRFIPTSEDAQRIHRAGKRIFLAGPLVAGQESKNWQAAADVGVDAILTDFPLELANQLRSGESSRPKALGYQTRKIEGWTVHVSDDLLQHQKEETEFALILLKPQLAEIVKKLPAGAVGKLREVPLWFSPEYPGVPPRAEYHPGADWLRANGRNPAMVQGIEFTNVRIFEPEVKRMPNFALHELAHAFHDRVLDFENREIIEAFDRIKASKKYEEVKRWNGPVRGETKERAYALTNAKEYFAESTEALFSRNDFFPFTAEELEKHDPEMFKLLGRVWGSAAAP